MSNKCFNEARFWTGNVPDIDSSPSCNCNKPVIRRETAVSGILIGHTELSHNYSRIEVLYCDSIPITCSKLSAI
jgi:hypothetical protein